MRKPTLLGAVASVVTAAGAYLLAISPQAVATAELRTELESARSANEASAAQIPTLKAQLADISGDVQALRALSQQVPPSIDLPALYAELDTVAAQVGGGVKVTNVSVTVPSLLTADPAAAPAATDPATADLADPNAAATVDPNAATDPNATGETAAGPNPAPAAVLASYEVTMTIEASPEQGAAFIKALGRTKRLNVVTTSGVSGGSEAEGGTLNVTATFYLQQVDVDGLAAQIEALASGQGVIAPGSDPIPAPEETAAAGS